MLWLGFHVYEGSCIFKTEREVGGYSYGLVVCRPISRIIRCVGTIVPAFVTANVGYHGNQLVEAPVAGRYGVFGVAAIRVTGVDEVPFDPHVDERRVVYYILGSLQCTAAEVAFRLWDMVDMTEVIDGLLGGIRWHQH